MNGLLKAIFQPKDGTRERVKEAMASSQTKMTLAANRFETVVKEMLDRNDQVTGRAGRNRDEEDFH